MSQELGTSENDNTKKIPSSSQSRPSSPYVESSDTDGDGGEEALLGPPGVREI